MNSQLDEVGDPASYRHVSKVIHSSAAVREARRRNAWGYRDRRGDRPCRARWRHWRAPACRRPTAEALAGELGFVILHRCVAELLLPAHHELAQRERVVETVWPRPRRCALLEPWLVEGPHRPTFCVWELRAVCHEPGAWTRYLRSARDADAKQSYLEDTYSGFA
jgi:hypothetical protein